MTRVVLAGLLTAVWAGLALGLLSILGPDWAAFAPASCLPNCFCEWPRRGGLLLQPANSLSSLGFVAVGAWIMLGAGDDRGRALGVAATLWLGFTAIVIGVGSLMLHATLTLWGQFADVLGMYLLGAFILAWAVVRWRGLGPVAGVVLYLVVAGGLVAALWVVPETRRWLFAVVLVVAIGVEWGLARPRRRGARAGWFLAGLAANIVAFVIWGLDQARVVCAPASWAQGHAVWHLLGAVAVLCSWVYYRSERRG